MMRRTLAMVMAVLVGASASSLAQTSETSRADARLRRALDEVHVKWNEDAQGDFTLHFTFEDARTHVVTAESGTQRTGAAEVRKIWAIAWKGAAEPPASLANKLLRENTYKKVGAWELRQQEDGTFVAVFSVQVPADCDAATLRSVVWGIAGAADAMEKELLKSDTF